MKTLGCIAAILVLAAAGAAEAKTPPHKQVAVRHRTPVKKPLGHTVIDRHGVAHHYSDAAWAQMQAKAKGSVDLAEVDQSANPRLGLDLKDGAADARLGVYKRPDAPNPYPTLYRGAGATAGVSVKLGGSGSP